MLIWSCQAHICVQLCCGWQRPLAQRGSLYEAPSLRVAFEKIKLEGCQAHFAIFGCSSGGRGRGRGEWLVEKAPRRVILYAPEGVVSHNRAEHRCKFGIEKSSLCPLHCLLELSCASLSRKSRVNASSCLTPERFTWNSRVNASAGCLPFTR